MESRIGANTMAGAISTEPTREVTRLTFEFSRVENDLGCVVGEIEKRLELVLLPPAPENADPSPKDSHGTPLGRALGDHLGRLDALAGKLRSIVARLEL